MEGDVTGPGSASFRQRSRPVPPPSVPPVDGMPADPGAERDELLGNLRDLVAGLNGYIERRAEEIAGPVVEAAAGEARQMVARVEESAQAEIGRLRDGNTELMRRGEAQYAQQAEMREHKKRLAVALGCDPLLTPWESLVAEIEDRLKGEA